MNTSTSRSLTKAAKLIVLKNMSILQQCQRNMSAVKPVETTKKCTRRPVLGSCGNENKVIVDDCPKADCLDKPKPEPCPIVGKPIPTPVCGDKAKPPEKPKPEPCPIAGKPIPTPVCSDKAKPPEKPKPEPCPVVKKPVPPPVCGDKAKPPEKPKPEPCPCPCPCPTVCGEKKKPPPEKPDTEKYKRCIFK